MLYLLWAYTWQSMFSRRQCICSATASTEGNAALDLHAKMTTQTERKPFRIIFPRCGSLYKRVCRSSSQVHRCLALWAPGGSLIFLHFSFPFWKARIVLLASPWILILIAEWEYVCFYTLRINWGLEKSHYYQYKGSLLKEPHRKAQEGSSKNRSDTPVHKPQAYTRAKQDLQTLKSLLIRLSRQTPHFRPVTLTVCCHYRRAELQHSLLSPQVGFILMGILLPQLKYKYLMA